MNKPSPVAYNMPKKSGASLFINASFIYIICIFLYQTQSSLGCNLHTSYGHCAFKRCPLLIYINAKYFW